MKYEIRCGEHHGIVEANSAGEAWRQITNEKTEGFSPLAAIRTRPYGFWRYAVPETFDNLK